MPAKWEYHNQGVLVDFKTEGETGVRRQRLILISEIFHAFELMEWQETLRQAGR